MLYEVWVLKTKWRSTGQTLTWETSPGYACPLLKEEVFIYNTFCKIHVCYKKNDVESIVSNIARQHRCVME